MKYSALILCSLSSLSIAVVSCSGGDDDPGTPAAGSGGTTTSSSTDAGDGDGEAGDGDGSTSAGGEGGGGTTLGEGGQGNETGDPDEIPDAPVTCDSDKACRAEDKVCDLDKRICVQCVGYEDCGDGELCELGSCVAAETCGSSKDCENPDHVCVDNELLGGICLECARTEDCDSDELCVSNVCVTGCDSDKDCARGDEVCRLDGGFCVECYDDVGCSDDQYCDGWSCVPKVCEPGATACAEDGVAECNALGSGYDAPESCDGFGCKYDAGVAGCDYPKSEQPKGALNQNGDFAAGGVGWKEYEATPAPTVDGAYCTSSGDYMELGWPVDVGDAALLEYERSYLLKFITRVSSDTDLVINAVDVKVGGPSAPYTEFFSEEMNQLPTGEQEHVFGFTMHEPTSSA